MKEENDNNNKENSINNNENKIDNVINISNNDSLKKFTINDDKNNNNNKDENELKQTNINLVELLIIFSF